MLGGGSSVDWSPSSSATNQCRSAPACPERMRQGGVRAHAVEAQCIPVHADRGIVLFRPMRRYLQHFSWLLRLHGRAAGGRYRAVYAAHAFQQTIASTHAALFMAERARRRSTCRRGSLHSRRGMMQRSVARSADPRGALGNDTSCASTRQETCLTQLRASRSNVISAAGHVAARCGLRSGCLKAWRRPPPH